MASRGQSLTIEFYAWDTGASAGKTGDSGNFTLRWVKDGTSAAPSNAASEVDATNAPGLYKLTLTAAECTANFGTLAGKSSTSGVVILPVSVTFEQLHTDAVANLEDMLDGTGGVDLNLRRLIIHSGGAGTALDIDGGGSAAVYVTSSIASSTVTIANTGGIAGNCVTFDSTNDVCIQFASPYAPYDADVRDFIRDAVWDALSANHLDTGTMGALLASIYAQAALISEDGNTILGMVSNDGTMTLVAGDDYTGTRAYSKTFVGGPDLTGGSPKLEFQKADGTNVQTAAGTITGSGTSGDPWVVTVPIPNAKTTLLDKGQYTEGARLRITLSGGAVYTPYYYLLVVKNTIA